MLEIEDIKNMKTIILAGGFGTRLSEYTDSIPKPMVEIGGKPILWHIMNLYAQYKKTSFCVALGYKGDVIKKYFSANFKKWNIELIDTGEKTMTGGRVKRLQEYIGKETCMLTYGDGLADINLNTLLAFHKSHGKFAKKYSLPFPLLSDKDAVVAQSYGSAFKIGPFAMAKRHTFIISPEGKIAMIYRKVNPSTHSNEVIGKLKILTLSN